jgi:protein TonB
LVVKKEVAITFAEEMPKYPEDKMYEDLAKNIVYPEKEKSFQIEGTLFVSFVVEKDGSTTEVQIIREIEGGEGFNKVATEAVKSLRKFEPAKMNGNAVRLRMTIPIRFSLR